MLVFPVSIIGRLIIIDVEVYNIHIKVAGARLDVHHFWLRSLLRAPSFDW
jgi:hypothetical protein